MTGQHREGAPCAALSLRSVLWPADGWTRLALAIVCLRPLVVWILPWVLRREPLDVTALFRPSGDVEYFEVMAAVARGNLGEPNLLERLGQGLMPFPFASLLVHAAAFAALGTAGFVVADVVVAWAFFAVCSLLMNASGAGPRAAPLAALFVGSMSYGFLAPLLEWIGWDPQILWGDRFPRPFVTEVIWLAALVPLVTIWTRPDISRRPRFWLAGGALLALLIQSDVYAATSTLLAALMTVLVAGRDPDGRKHVVRGTALAGAAFAVVIAPFALQRMAVTPDLLVRMGVYPLARREAFTVLAESGFAPVFIAAAACGALLWAQRRDDGNVGRRIALFWFTLTVLATVSGAAFTAALGQGIQFFHFSGRAQRLCAYATVLAVAVVGPRIICAPWLARAAPVAVAALAIAAVSTRALSSALRTCHVRTAMCTPGHDTANYRAALAGLAIELDKPAYREARVMATIDQPVHVLWNVFHGGQTFVPDQFPSTAPNQELERRLILFARAAGLAGGSFETLVQAKWTNAFYCCGGKYSVNKRYTLFPFEAYSPAQQRMILQTPIVYGFSYRLPPAEVARLRDALEAAPKSTETPPRLDLMVLTKDPLFSDATPAPQSFTLVFENAGFRLFSAVAK